MLSCDCTKGIRRGSVGITTSRVRVQREADRGDETGGEERKEQGQWAMDGESCMMRQERLENGVPMNV